MKNLLKFIQTIVIILSMTVISQAQINNDLKTQSIYLGYVPVSGLSSTNMGLHIGYSKINNSLKRISGELQASYTLATFKGSGDGFFERENGHIQIFNTLAGGRLYFVDRKKGNGNIYINVLAGITFLNDKEESRPVNNEVGLGYSLGIFFETKNNLSFGVAVETAATGVLKVGYRF